MSDARRRNYIIRCVNENVIPEGLTEEEQEYYNHMISQKREIKEKHGYDVEFDMVELETE